MNTRNLFARILFIIPDRRSIVLFRHIISRGRLDFRRDVFQLRF